MVQANGKMDRLDQLRSKLRRRYRAGQAVPKNIARHLTRIALALSMCLQHQLAAFHPIPRPSAPPIASSAPAQPNPEAPALAAESAQAQQPVHGPSSSIDNPTDTAVPIDADVSQVTDASVELPSQPDALQPHASTARASRPAQLEPAPSQLLVSDDSAQVSSHSAMTNLRPAAHSPTGRQAALAGDGPHAGTGPHAGDIQQQHVAASVAREPQGACGKEEQSALRWQQSAQQVLQFTRHAVAMWKLAQQLQPNHKGRKRTGAVFLLASPLSPGGTEAGSADDPAALLDLAASNLRR